MFGKTYELSLTRDYVRHWGVIEAIRELIQNAIDSDSPFTWEVNREDDDTFTLSLISANTELPTRSLLLGSTTKAEATDKIGSFGEGYKIALLVLAREGLKVAIWNGARHWSPLFQHSRKYDADVLCVAEEAMPHRNQGLRFLVSGLSSDQMQDVFDSCLQMQEHIGRIRQTPKGDILLERPGKLYVGGLYICDTDTLYGYNVKPEFIKLERDRKTVDTWDFRAITQQMWYATEDFDRIAQMIEAKAPEMEYAQYSAPVLVKEACYRLFREKHPGAIVAESNDELKKLVREGMKNVVYVPYAPLVSEAPSYRNERPVRLPTPTEKMERWWAKAKYHIHHDHKATFEALLKDSTHWRLQ